MALDGGAYTVVDTLKTNAEGCISTRIPVVKGQPEFYYFFWGDTKIFSLLLETPEKISVEADTLGRWTVSGSPESEKLRQVESDRAAFISKLAVLASQSELPRAEISRLYIEYYRSCVRYIIENSHSMTSIQVVYDKINDSSPIFAQFTDAIHYRNLCDSLKLSYPESRYVKSLEAETEKLERQMALSQKLYASSQLSYPDITLPDITGAERTLSSVDSPLVLLYFWSPENAAQKMYNLDVLKKIYDKYHSRGLEIFAVAVTPDKVQWASVVNSQKMPWINVCDKTTGFSPAASSYNVSVLPASFLLSKEESIVASGITGEAALRSAIEKALK